MIQEISRLKAKLETLTGKMVCFRSREAYRMSQAKAQKRRRARLKKAKV